MLRNTDVSEMMDKVHAALRRSSRNGETAAVIYVHPIPTDPFGIEAVRVASTIAIDLPSGSNRAVVGRVIRFAKRVFRRSVRWYAQPIVTQQSEVNLRLADVDERLADATIAARENVRELEARVELLEGLVDRITGDVEQIRSTTRDPGGEPETLNHGVQTLLKYSGFEQRHRGTEKSVRPLLEEYVPYFRGCRRVLDLGCGRGEFLELLTESGIPAYGVDSDESMVNVAVAGGKDVRLVDAVDHLRGLTVGEVDGMFSSQVAEHLTTNQLVTTVDLAYRKLAPGGVFVMETPNPEALFIFATFFYVDLTHIKPIHPEALKWAFEAAGFDDVEIRRVQPVPESARLTPIPEGLRSEPGWEMVARNTDTLNELIFGYQHYAVIGRKPKVGE